MTEEQANELATRLTVALIQERKLPADHRRELTAAEIAQAPVELLLAIREGLLQGSAKRLQ